MRLGVRVKIMIFAVIISLVLGLILTGNSIIQQKDILINELKKRGLSLSRSLASGCVLDVLLEDKESLQEMVRKIKEKEKDVVYVIIEDEKGKSLVRMGEIIKKGLAAPDKKVVNFFKTEKGEIYEFVAPILTAKVKEKEGILEASVEKELRKGHLRRIGTVRLGISLESIKKATNLLVRRNLFLIFIVTALSAWLIFYFLWRIIVAPLIYISTFAKRVASQADLTQRINIKTKDEIEQLSNAFNNLVDSMHNIVSQIQSTADKVATFSQQLSSSTQQVNASTQEVSISIQQINKGAVNQAKRLDETKKIIEEAVTSLRKMADNAQTATGKVVEASNQAEGGQESAKRTAEKIDYLTDAVANSAATIQLLAERSEKIGEITKTITSIADQTNLLALNAAIEAARAGEAGRGFAVVAEEIRKLAENSANAVKEIDNLIKSIQSDVAQAVGSIEKSNKEAQEGREAVTKIAQLLVEINKSVQEASFLTKQISEATQEQVKENERMMKATEEVVAIAQESVSATEKVSSSVEEQTASMQEMASSAQELARLAMELKDMVAKFKLKR